MSLLHRTHNDGHNGHDDLPELSPAQLAELDALDAALAGEEIADDALAALVREVRSAAPELGTDGTQAMNDRLGVALDPAIRAAGGRRRQIRGLLYGPSAVAASVLLVAAIGGGAAALVGARSDDDDAAAITELATSFDTTDQGNEYRPDPSDTASENAASAAAPPIMRQSQELQGLSTQTNRTPGSSGTTPQALSQVITGSADTLNDSSRASGRAVERAIDLSVRVKTGELPDASGKVSQITRDADGYVATSDMNLGTAGAGIASFSLRVDSAKLDRAVDRLSALGTVTRQNESSQDITSTLDSATKQFADARKTRAALLKALGKATGATEIARLRAQIASNRRTLARLDANVQRVERRASLTTISLALEAPAKGDPTADDGSWSLGDAAGDAWSALRAILGGLLVSVAVLAPFALIGGTGYALWRRRQRAARERALDA